MHARDAAGEDCYGRELGRTTNTSPEPTHARTGMPRVKNATVESFAAAPRQTGHEYDPKMMATLPRWIEAFEPPSIAAIWTHCLSVAFSPSTL